MRRMGMSYHSPNAFSFSTASVSFLRGPSGRQVISCPNQCNCGVPTPLTPESLKDLQEVTVPPWVGETCPPDDAWMEPSQIQSQQHVFGCCPVITFLHQGNLRTVLGGWKMQGDLLPGPTWGAVYPRRQESVNNKSLPAPPQSCYLLLYGHIRKPRAVPFEKS